MIDIYIQCLLEKILLKNQIGLYPDEGYKILRSTSNQQKEKIPNKDQEILKKIDFKTCITANLTEVEFLDKIKISKKKMRYVSVQH